MKLLLGIFLALLVFVGIGDAQTPGQRLLIHSRHVSSCNPPYKTITATQSAPGVTSGATPVGNVAVTFGAAVRTGGTVITAVSWDSGGGAVVSNMTDDQGNVYAPLDTVVDTGNNQSTEDFYAFNITNAPMTMTATFSIPAAFVELTADEFANVLTTSPLDGHIGNFQATVGTSANAVTSGTISTAANGDLIWGVTVESSGAGGPFTAGTGFTAGDLALQAFMLTEHKDAPFAGTPAATFTTGATSTTSTAVVALKPAPATACSGVLPPPPPVSTAACLTGTPIEVTSPPYNAVADGTTDNLPAFNNALVASASSGRPVHVKAAAGMYAYNGDIQVVGGAELYGDLTAANPTATVLKPLDGTNSAVRLSGTKPIAHNFKVQGNGGGRLGNNDSSGVYADGDGSATQYLMQNIWVDATQSVGFFNGAGSFINGATHGHVLSNLATNTQADSFHVQGGANFIEFDHNKTMNSGDDEFSNVSYSGGTGLTHDNYFHDNVGMGGNARGLSIVGGRNIRMIHNNTSVVSNKAAAYFATESGFSSPAIDGTNTIMNNTFLGSGGPTGHGTIQFFADSNPISGITISNNQVLNPVADVVQSTGSQPVTSTSIINNNYYYSGSHNDFNNGNPNAAITVSGNTDSAPGAYPGDNPPTSIGGLGTVLTLACP